MLNALGVTNYQTLAAQLFTSFIQTLVVSNDTQPVLYAISGEPP